ncbi:MAG: hypothetical protein NVS2B7_28210 [Herpetosiphon sp.]
MIFKTKAHLFDRCVDLLLDPRLPQATLYNLWRLWRFPVPHTLPRLQQPLRVCLTFDIEHDFRDPANAHSARRFLIHYLPLARLHGWRSTLYVQGDLVPLLADLLHEAQVDHEIGLHGLHHEVWGRSRWWQYRLGFIGLSRREKEERLQQATELFDNAGLKSPKSFRAPYLNSDRQTLALLARNGFTTDSSQATYLGALPLARRQYGVYQIPVTATPRPAWHGSLVRYLDLTMGNLVTMEACTLRRTIASALQVQSEQQRRFHPHLVLLAHPWEFEKTVGVAHSSEANWARLAQIVQLLQTAYVTHFTTMSDLCDSAPGTG